MRGDSGTGARGRGRARGDSLSVGEIVVWGLVVVAVAMVICAAIDGLYVNRPYEPSPEDAARMREFLASIIDRPGPPQMTADGHAVCVSTRITKAQSR